MVNPLNIFACELSLTIICISALKQEMAPGENKRTDGDSGCLQGNRKCVAVHWYRHGLRLHDNPSLLAALEGADSFYPIFIFDGEVAGKYQIILHFFL